MSDVLTPMDSLDIEIKRHGARLIIKRLRAENDVLSYFNIKNLREAWENEISNQASDHSFDFENVLQEVFGDNYYQE